MPSNLDRAILETLIYSDIFDYPLRLGEIGKWLIKCKVQSAKCKAAVENLKLIKEKNGFCFLKGKDKIVDLREEREKFSREKLKISQKIARFLKFIPSVKLVGITGALAMGNGKKDDDIDIFIITSSGLLWTTRFLTTLLVEFTGQRRHPQDENVNNKVCLNMFVDAKHMEIPKKERDLFSAHEVLQMKPLFDRNSSYQKFLTANQWVKKYLPNAYKEITLARSDKDTSDMAKQRLRLLGWWRKQINIFRLFESFLKKFQLWYMRKHRTSEVIKDGIIRFHPHDAREWVMKKYKSSLN